MDRCAAEGDSDEDERVLAEAEGGRERERVISKSTLNLFTDRWNWTG
jgi:hypothetical protein